MPSSSYFIRKIAELTGEKEHRLMRMGVSLRGAGLIQKTGRGRSAADFTPRECAYLLLAMMGAESDNDTVPAAKRIYDWKNTETEEFFGKTLEDLLSDPDGFCKKVIAVMVCRNSPYALIQHYKKYLVKPPDVVEELPNGMKCFNRNILDPNQDPAPGLTIQAYLNGSVIQELANLFYQFKED
jgi:hypothetical protein